MLVAMDRKRWLWGMADQSFISAVIGVVYYVEGPGESYYPLFWEETPPTTTVITATNDMCFEKRARSRKSKAVLL